MKTDGLNTSAQPLRVLVIDDDEGGRDTLRIMFEDQGVNVLTTDDGNDGLALCKTNQVDLVITDIFMPTKSGGETISELRQCQPGIRIIAVSGGGQVGGSSVLKLAKQWGADEVIQKPFDFDEMTLLVRALLPGRSVTADGARPGEHDTGGSR